MAEDLNVSPVDILTQQLWNDPKTRPGMEALIAELHPERAAIAVPAHALRREIADAKAGLDKDREAFKAEQDAAKQAKVAEQQLAAWHAGLAEHGARPEEFKAINTLALELKIGNPKAVVREYREQQALASPSPGNFGVQIPGAKMGEFFKGLDENADQWARNQAAKDIHTIKTRGLAALDPSPVG